MTEQPTKTAACRHGTFTWHAEDKWVGRSLELYGEFSEEEAIVYCKILKAGDTAIDVGANIGTMTVPMSHRVGPAGRIIAIEPQPETLALLRRNVADNQLDNVTVIGKAASSRRGKSRIPALHQMPGEYFSGVEVGYGEREIELFKIDDLKLDSLALLKIDAEGHERLVLQGAKKTIAKYRPIIYCENNRPDKSGDLIGALVDLGYRLWWHRPTIYRHENWREEKRNFFGGMVSQNMCCLPEESKHQVMNADEVTDLRMTDDMCDREIRRYQRILEHHPDDKMARLMVACFNNYMQRSDVAWDLINQNLKDEPDHVATRHVAAFFRLQAGDYTAWPDYEYRYMQRNSQNFGNRPRDGKKWDGTPTTEPVLVWSEQGFGDSIMFGRFISRALERAPNLFLEVQSPLFELFELSELVPKGRLYRQGRQLPEYKLHCSIPSLPAVLDVGFDIGMDKPYLKADPYMAKNWRRPTRPEIGICTVGSPFSERAFTRDLPDKFVEPIAIKHGPFLSLHDTGHFGSFADTAAAISTLDLVITVDTAVAHLAGALGVETWLLLSFDPDFRWGLKGETTPWYPSMRIFRQTNYNDWPSVMDQLMAALDERAQARSQEAAE